MSRELLNLVTDTGSIVTIRSESVCAVETQVRWPYDCDARVYIVGGHKFNIGEDTARRILAEI